jgi:hypothetical protein
MQRHSAPNRQTDRNRKADNELLIKGGLCTLIGVCVLLSPYFLQSPALRDTIAQASAAGWFALALGLAFIALFAHRRWSAGRKH